MEIETKEILAKIGRHIRRREIIEAIREYRLSTNAGLRAAYNHIKSYLPNTVLHNLTQNELEEGAQNFVEDLENERRIEAYRKARSSARKAKIFVECKKVFERKGELMPFNMKQFDDVVVAIHDAGYKIW